MNSYTLEPVGFIRSTVKGACRRAAAGSGRCAGRVARDRAAIRRGIVGNEVGHELIVITWLHEARRDVLQGHPRSDESRPLNGVFYTRMNIGPIEVFDGTPVVDIKSASTRADG